MQTNLCTIIGDHFYFESSDTELINTKLKVFFLIEFLLLFLTCLIVMFIFRILISVIVEIIGIHIHNLKILPFLFNEYINMCEDPSYLSLVFVTIFFTVISEITLSKCCPVVCCAGSGGLAGGLRT